MRFIGVVDQGWETSDGEIGGFLAAHDRDGAVVALDAPLVVRNPAGTSRGCERELQRRYGRAGVVAVEVFPAPALVELGRLDELRGRD